MVEAGGDLLERRPDLLAEPGVGGVGIVSLVPVAADLRRRELDRQRPGEEPERLEERAAEVRRTGDQCVASGGDLQGAGHRRHRRDHPAPQPLGGQHVVDRRGEATTPGDHHMRVRRVGRQIESGGARMVRAHRHDESIFSQRLGPELGQTGPAHRRVPDRRGHGADRRCRRCSPPAPAAAHREPAAGSSRPVPAPATRPSRRGTGR